MTESDLLRHAAYHATASDATTHRPALAGCSCPQRHGWIPVDVALPAIDGHTLSFESVDCNILITDPDGSQRVSAGYRFEAGDYSYWFDVLRQRRVTVTHWQPLPPLPGDAAEPLTMAECLAQAAWWQRRAAEIGTKAVTTPDETEAAEYWRGRAAEAERELRAAKDLDSKQIV